MYSNKNNIEKTKIIPIKKSPSSEFNIEDKDKEYSLKQNIFDPTNFSPPNEFLLKLNMRIQMYNSTTSS